MVADLNVPGAKSSEALNDLCSVIQFCNDLAPTRTVCLLELPEVAKKSSKRGLADEEAEVQTNLWSLRQSCDARWICPFHIHPSADAQTNRRQDSCQKKKNSDQYFLTSVTTDFASFHIVYQSANLKIKNVQSTSIKSCQLWL